MEIIDDCLRASIDELMNAFRGALLALVPIADRSQLVWADEDTNPAWERLACGVFDTFVGGPIATDRSRAGGDRPLAPYDNDVESYSGLSWIAVGEPVALDRAFVRVLSRRSPFDSIQIARLDPTTGDVLGREVMDWGSEGFFLVRRSVTGVRRPVMQVVAEE